MSSTTVAPSTKPAERSFFGHPRGLAVLFSTELFERFSYYGMRALLILYMTASAAAGGLAMDSETAGAIYGLYTGAAYLCCLPGGWVADRILGQRRSVFNGGILIAAGNFLLAVPATIAFFLGLTLTALGTGLLKPNVSAVVGELYHGQSGARRDAAFSIFYLGINIGGFLAPFVSGTIGETIGYRWGFFSAGVAMLIGLVRYRATEHYLGQAGIAPASSDRAERRKANRLLLIGLSLLVALALAFAGGLIKVDLVALASEVGLGMLAVAVLFFGWVFLAGRLQPAERRRVFVIAIFFVCAALFWAGFEQAGSTLNLFARDYTDRHLFGAGFASGEHPVSWYQSINSLYILVLSGAFAALWTGLGKRARDPSAPAKVGLGLVQLGLSFLIMLAAAQLVVKSGGKAGPQWLVLTYLVQTTGELCLSPIGLSNVTKLAPARFAGQMMGTWFLGAAVGNLAAGLIGGHLGASSIETMPAEFGEMALVAGGSGLLMLLLSPLIRRWMGGVR